LNAYSVTVGNNSVPPGTPRITTFAELGALPTSIMRINTL